MKEKLRRILKKEMGEIPFAVTDIDAFVDRLASLIVEKTIFETTITFKE